MNRYRFPIAILALSALTLFLFFTASPAPDAQAAPRTIPWDCSDWQESPAVTDADDARVSMILESLAANRGKSIYCAIDQSDTWTKTETWEAGRDRNERDDTVYFGQSGNFRGFLSAQEGYLTDGESGVTGVSRELIFEFPEEPRRGKKTVTKRLRVPTDDRLCTPFDGAGATITRTDNQVQTFDRYPNYHNGPEYDASCRRVIGPWGSWTHSWQTIKSPPIGRNQAQRWPRRSRTRAANAGNVLANADWDALSQAAATAYCLERGYERAANVVATSPARPSIQTPGDPNYDNDYWVYEKQRSTNPVHGTSSKYRAAPANTWSATCEKKVRVRRR